ncbi:MAG TPA: hypothetical protein VGQ09_08760 [Chitinophagaceae bacterium]|jgi:hypothetical protein|nr:hypothetical protein [Chitinophagaceae bacterium]
MRQRVTTAYLTKAISFALVILLLLKCNTVSKTINKNLKAITVKVELPILSPDNTGFITAVDSLNIIYYQNLTIFQIPYFNSFYQFINNSSGQIVGQTHLKDELKKTYLIYQNHSSYGCQFDSINAVPRTVLIDSFFKTKTLYTFNP